MKEKVSFSRVDTWRQCPRKYKYRYMDKIPQKPDYSATNPLVLGSTLDTGIEKGYEEAEKYYRTRYYVTSDEMETELMKIEHWIPEIHKKLEGTDGEFQVKLETDRFIGFMDYYDEKNGLLIDFKYSNNTEKYADSAQLHVYASELPKIPEYMCYLCVPKTFIRQKKTEDIILFRRRVMDTLEEMELQLVWIDYDQSKVDAFWEDAEAMENDTAWEPKPNESKCKWCDYKDICNPMLEIERPVRVRKLKPRSELKI